LFNGIHQVIANIQIKNEYTNPTRIFEGTFIVADIVFADNLTYLFRYDSIKNSDKRKFFHKYKTGNCPIVRAKRGAAMPNKELEVARAKVMELLGEVGLELNGKKREFLATLQRRANWLEARTTKARSEGRALHYDEAELAATKWAVSQAIVQEAELKRLREDIKRLRAHGAG
jgi:hypothetical protein